MKEYLDYIKNLSFRNKNIVFYNSGAEHAAIVMGTMFEKATKSLKIFAGGLSGDVSNSSYYKEGIEKFLRSGGCLQILLQSDKLDKEKEPPLFNLLRFYAFANEAQIQIKQHPFKVQKNEGVEIHFCVADDKMYRLEEDIDKFTATGNFNDEIIAKRLSDIFDDIFDRSESRPISLIKNLEPVG